MSDSNLISCLYQEIIPCLIPSNPLVIIGDLNIDGLQRNNSIRQLSDMFSYKMLLEDSTTDHMSLLDFISYVDVSSVDYAAGTYWSDHKTFFLRIKFLYKYRRYLEDLPCIHCINPQNVEIQ